MLLAGRAAIVTGAGTGIGSAIAKRLAQEGAAVAVADIDEERGLRSVGEIVEAGGHAIYVRMDVADVESIERAVEAVAIEFGKIDILVNNAGVTRKIGLLEMTPDEWDWIQTINTRGSFFCLQRVAERMKDTGGGHIVNIASIAGKGLPGASNASYSASKAALIVLGRVGAIELGKYDIKVNTICPGLTRTELAEQVAKQIPSFFERRAEESALGRVNDPDDIANTVVFLCSEWARNITGQSINVDGGTIWD